MILGVHYLTCQSLVERHYGYLMKWHLSILPHLSEKFLTRVAEFANLN